MNRPVAALVTAALTATLGACSASSAPPASPAPTALLPSRLPSSTPGLLPSSTPGPVTGTAPGRDFQVGTTKLKFSNGADRPLPTTVWYPTDGDGPFPMILFSHGLTSEPVAYKSLLEPWAEAGFVVAAPAYPYTSYGVAETEPIDVINQPGDATEVITRMLALNDKPGGKLSGKIDPTRIAAAGHSAGGITTVGMFSGNRDDRLTAGIVLSGRLGLPVPFTGKPAPILFVHGQLDKTVPYKDGMAAFNAVPWPKAMMNVTKGGHVAITKEFRPVITTTTDFLRYALYGDPDAKDRLKADATNGNRAKLDDRL